MPLPRIRLRTLLIVVAAVAIALGAELMRRKAAVYRQRAAWHSMMETLCRQRAHDDARSADFFESESDPHPDRASIARLYAQHGRSMQKLEEELGEIMRPVSPEAVQRWRKPPGPGGVRPV